MTTMQDRAHAMFDLRHRRAPRGGAETRVFDRGEVWLLDLGETVGSEQSWVRPGLVWVTDAAGLRRGEMVTILPMTTRLREGVPSRVTMVPPEGGLSRPSDVMADQMRTVSTLRLQRLMGIASPATMARVSAVLQRLMGL